MLLTLFISLALLVAEPVRSARVVAREAPKVQVSGQGVVAGREVAVTRSLKARQYLGIPFAQPPLGDLRFAAPVTSPLPSWDEPRNSSFQPACMQDRDRFEDHDKLRLEIKLFPEDRLEFSEDCLYLNVYSPEGPEVQPLYEADTACLCHSQLSSDGGCQLTYNLT